MKRMTLFFFIIIFCMLCIPTSFSHCEYNTRVEYHICEKVKRFYWVAYYSISTYALVHFERFFVVRRLLGHRVWPINVDDFFLLNNFICGLKKSNKMLDFTADLMRKFKFFFSSLGDAFCLQINHDYNTELFSLINTK